MSTKNLNDINFVNIKTDPIQLANILTLEQYLLETNSLFLLLICASVIVMLRSKPTIS